MSSQVARCTEWGVEFEVDDVWGDGKRKRIRRERRDGEKRKAMIKSVKARHLFFLVFFNLGSTVQYFFIFLLLFHKCV